MSKYTEQSDDVTFSEPILAQKGVKCKVVFAELTQWEAKTNGEKNGKKFDACKLTIQIDDDTVRTEHADAKPKLTIEDQFNIEPFPYESKKEFDQDGRPLVKMLGRTKLYQLEEAFGFDPIFQVNGTAVAPFITRTGKKVAPKLEGVKRVLNPDFFDAYFTAEGIPVMTNWENKTVYADIEVVTHETYGSKNVVGKYVKAPTV